VKIVVTEVRVGGDEVADIGGYGGGYVKCVCFGIGFVGILFVIFESHVVMWNSMASFSASVLSIPPFSTADMAR
jgi:hypothetical protein